MSDDKKSNLFRKESLERLSSPERLDRLLQVVNPKEWVALTCLGSLIIGGLLWSIFGRIPITVNGKGILIDPEQIVNLQSPLNGQLQNLKIKVGDCIEKNTVIADLAQPELEKQLQQQQINLSELQQQDQDLLQVNQNKIQVERQAIATQKQNLLQKQKDTQELAIIIENQGVISLKKEAESLQQKLENLTSLTPILLNRLQIRKDLKKEGAIADDVVLSSEEDYRNNLNQISDLESQLEQLEVKKLQIYQTYKNSQNQLIEITAQLRELDTRESNLLQQNYESSITRKNKIDEVKRAIAQLEVQLNNNSQIKSEYQGCILELITNQGQVVNPGTILGKLEKASVNKKVISLTYFPIKDGKKIQKAMKMQIIPDTIKREEFGGILGKVSSVSNFSVTKEKIIKDIGNTEISEGLIIPGGQIEVKAELELDSGTFSGYKWSSSKGPKIKISRGTTATIQVTIGEQAPITFLLPILRGNTNVY